MHAFMSRALRPNGIVASSTMRAHQIRGGGLGRDDSQTGLRVTGVRLNLEPDLKLAVL